MEEKTNENPLRMKFGVALVIALLTISLSLQAQGEWGGVSFKSLFIDYQTLSADGDFGAFREYTVGLEFSYFHNITDHFSVELPIKMGTANLLEEKNIQIFGADIHANYKFRDPEKHFRPYVLAGAGFVIENGDSSNIQIPVGFGLDFRVAPGAYITWQSEVRFSLDENRDNFNHSIGFKYMFGAPKEVIIPPVLDTDGDGIVDTLDRCPLIPGLEVFFGCPDTDGDGIPDSDDDCPEYPGLAEFNGCPDSDGDGVPDNDDECPNDPGPVENNGCPLNDRDDDGIEDDMDDCPDTPGLVRFNGCPDTDGDGLRDIDDLCPNTAGPIENQGCPVIKAEHREILEFAMQAVEFEHGSARLSSGSHGLLKQIVGIMDAYPDYRLEISGHTDSTGADAFNQKLSEQRAKSCYDYLVGQGVSARRVSFVGHGETMPIADNETQDGRQLNRRVEFNMIPGLN